MYVQQSTAFIQKWRALSNNTEFVCEINGKTRTTQGKHKPLRWHVTDHSQYTGNLNFCFYKLWLTFDI